MAYEVKIVKWDRSSETRKVLTDKQLEGLVKRASKSPLVAAIWASKDGKRAKKVYGAKASENPAIKKNRDK